MRAPAALGVKSTYSVQVAPAATVTPLHPSLSSVNSFVGAAPRLVPGDGPTVKGSFPVLVNTVVRSDEVVVTTWLGRKLSVLGVNRPESAGVGEYPVRGAETRTVPPLFLKVMVPVMSPRWLVRTRHTHSSCRRWRGRLLRCRFERLRDDEACAEHRVAKRYRGPGVVVEVDVSVLGTRGSFRLVVEIKQVVGQGGSWRGGDSGAIQSQHLGRPVASSVNVRVAVSAAVVDGVKVIHIGQLAPGWSWVVLLPQALGLYREKSALLVPPIAGLTEKVTGAVPVLRIDTRSPASPSLLPFAPLLWPLTTEPEFIGDAGVNPMVLDSATPVPESDTVAVPIEPVIVSVSVSAAAEAGVNWT